MSGLKITSAYVMLCLFTLSATIVLAIISHLIYVAYKKSEIKSRCKNKAVLFMISITLVGIISFFISIVFIVAIIIQIILLDVHQLHPDVSKIDEIYYSSFAIMEYLICIFDQFGHLSMLTVFIVRLKMCFTNSVFGVSKIKMRFLYCCLISLTTFSFIIIVLVTNDCNPQTIIISEIIWELFIEIMCLYLVYLFVSKLQSLVKTAIGTNRKDLRSTISYNISQKSRDSRMSKRVSRSVNDTTTARSARSERGRSPSPSPSPSPTPRNTRSPSPSPSPKPSTPNQTVLNNQNLVNVMTKMTLLVVISVLGSILSLIGNVYVEIHELETIEKHTADIQSMYAFLLPVFDMILASLMLYLQFDFTKNVYVRLCGKMDIIFIEFCGDLLDTQITNTKQQELKSVQTVSSIKETTLTIQQSNISSRHSSINLTPTTQNKTKRLTLDITRPSEIKNAKKQSV